MPPKPNEPGSTRIFEREDAKAASFLKISANTAQRAHLPELTASKAVLGKLKAVHQIPREEKAQVLHSQFHTFRTLDRC